MRAATTARVRRAGLAGPRSQRLVLAVHYPWYGTPVGPTGRWRHWNHARLEMPEGRILGFHDPRRLTGPGRLDIGATHYPDGGPYDSRDPARIRAQLALAREAGLDGFAVSWWGRESEEALGLAALFRHAREAGLVLAPYYETGELWRRGALGVADDLISLLDRHGSEPAWLRVGGVPVVFLYASHRLRPRVWDAVRARLVRRGGASTSWPTRRAPSGSRRGRTGSGASTRSTCTRRSCSWREAARGRRVPALCGPGARGRPAVRSRRSRPASTTVRSGRRAPSWSARTGATYDETLAGRAVGRSAVDPRLELERVARGQRDRAERGARAAVSRRDPRLGRALPAGRALTRPRRPRRAPLGPRALPVEGIQRLGVEPPRVEFPDVREQRPPEPPPVLLVRREGPAERRGELLQHGGLVDPRDAPLADHDLARDHHRSMAAARARWTTASSTGVPASR